MHVQADITAYHGGIEWGAQNISFFLITAALSIRESHAQCSWGFLTIFMGSHRCSAGNIQQVPPLSGHALADSQIGIFMKNAFLFIFILAQLALFIVFSTYKRSEVGLFHFSRSLKAILTTLLLAASF